LPGVPDTWNELLYASLLQAGKGSWKLWEGWLQKNITRHLFIPKQRHLLQMIHEALICSYNWI
jgi:hypothetical protein